MNETERLAKLEELRKFPSELEWLEFKGAKEDYQFDNVGMYFSALCNEANLHEKSAGWLILGVDKKHNVIGTSWRKGSGSLDALKHEISRHTTHNLTFTQIHEVTHPDGRVLMFEVPPAPHGMPIAWRGHFYGRNGESLNALNLAKMDRIRDRSAPDWSAVIVDGATTANDLDQSAIAAARVAFKKKNPQLGSEVDGWNVQTFLNKAKLTRDGKITRTAILLLGKNEASHQLSPADARMTWILRTDENSDADYAHFGPPYLLSTNALYSKIRNLTYRIMPGGSLFPHEILKYDAWVVRELLHNCIAHQDYCLRGRINVMERPDSLRFENLGGFLPDSVSRVLQEDYAPTRARNPFLVTAMVNVNMIDTIGSGIKRAFRTQRERGFPLPDYDLEKADRVVVSISGKVIDENYTRALLSELDLSLDDVIALDKVQKRKELTEAEQRSLKLKKLIEGRRPNFYVSARVAAATGREVEHVLNSGLEDSHYKELVLTLLRKFGPATPEQINGVLLAKLPTILSGQQKKDKVRNLIQEMSKKDKSIRNTGKRGKGAVWALSD